MNSVQRSNQTYGSIGTTGGSEHSNNAWLPSFFTNFTSSDGSRTTSTSASSSSSSSESIPRNPIEGAIHSARDAISSTGKALFLTPTIARMNRSTTPMKTSQLPVMAVVEEAGEEREEVSSTPESQSSPPINIRSGMDGAEVELVPENFSPLSDSQRSSFLFTSSSNETISMKLTVLRGRDLPFERNRLRISVIDPDDSSFADILGWTPNDAPGHSPLWGGPSNSWPVVGTQTTQLLFVVTDQDGSDSSSLASSSNGTNGHDVGGAVEARAATTCQPIVCARVLTGDLLDGGIKRNPNCWIKLTDYGKTGITFCGRIEVRLTRPIEATLHKQENCPRISPGPAFPRLQSYAVRKMALYSCTPVVLNVYDVSNNPQVMQINNTMKTIGYGGIFHAAIEILGREYSFGGTRNKKSNVTGVFTATPKQCPMHRYRESVYLGDCELNVVQIQGILQDLRPRWKANSYSLFRKNCAFFSREFAIELGVGDIPQWVYCLASTAEFIEPYAAKLNNYLHARTTAAATNNKTASASDQKKNRRTKTSSNDSSSSSSSSSSSNEGGRSPFAGVKPGLSEEDARELSEILDADQTREAQNVATSTQESLLDHAMAARIQRSVRATNSRRLSSFRTTSKNDIRRN